MFLQLIELGDVVLQLKLLPIQDIFFFFLPELMKKVGIIMLTCFRTGLAKKKFVMLHANLLNEAN